MTEYEPHPIVWTRERAARLWQYYGSQPDNESIYFTAHSGGSVLRFVREHVPLEGKLVLDFGCGRGSMLKRLAAQGVSCQGLEFSAASAAEAERNVGAHPLFRGVLVADALPSSIAAESVDVVLLIEVIEHLLPDDIQPTLAEIRRVLKPGGRVVVTTPHDEDLAASMLHCPDCGSTFHRWQHVRTFKPAALSSLMAGAGFEEQLCAPLTFTMDASRPAGLLRTVLGAVARLRHGAPRPPHLAFVGRRPVSRA
jgi:2-polyprenyl-3-methyl-5-hydroxy-6-metoxy-1,4-benzoquinol methylase